MSKTKIYVDYSAIPLTEPLLYVSHWHFLHWRLDQKDLVHNKTSLKRMSNGLWKCFPLDKMVLSLKLNKKTHLQEGY